jgi:CTP:molybdopterin cytidylyltransferase MocA
VTTGATGRLVAAWRDGAAAVAATYQGRMRTPVLLDRSVWEEVRAGLSGDRGAGPWLRAHPDRVAAVEVGDVADDIDVDTGDDLEAIRRRIRPL